MNPDEIITEIKNGGCCCNCIAQGYPMCNWEKCDTFCAMTGAVEIIEKYKRIQELTKVMPYLMLADLNGVLEGGES